MKILVIVIGLMSSSSWAACESMQVQDCSTCAFHFVTICTQDAPAQPAPRYEYNAPITMPVLK